MSATSEPLQAVVDTGVPYPAIASLEAADGRRHTVTVRWAEGKRQDRLDRVDLWPLIGTHRFYAPLRNNPSLFETAHLVENGHAIAWGEDFIDMAATSVERLAEEVMTGTDFCAFLHKHSLTHQAAAAVLGRSKRQIEYYLQDEQIPRVVALACIGYEARYAPKASAATYPRREATTASFLLMRTPDFYPKIPNEYLGTAGFLGGYSFNLFNGKFAQTAVANTSLVEMTYLRTDTAEKEKRYG